MLTEAKIARAAAKERAYKMADGGGLYLMVTPAGGKLWRMNYRFQGKQKTLSLGKWPVVTLIKAREAAVEAKRMLQEGCDPGAAKKEETRRAFGAVALAWFERHKSEWGEKHKSMVWRELQHDILPVFGSRPIDSITPVEIDAVLQDIARRSVSVAHKAKGVCGEIFTSAVFEGLCPSNPALLMRGRLPKAQTAHIRTILDPGEVGALLRAIDQARDRHFLFTAWSATRLLPLVFTRPGELRLAAWSEISFDEAILRIPAERMKMRQPHLVPLSRQALEILKELRGRAPGETMVFASKGKVFSHCRIWMILKKIGYGDRISPHGFRAMARTLLHERLHFSPDAIEAQLAHRVPDRLGAAYNRSQHLEERIRMMQAWADWLDSIRDVIRGCE